jgi:hypothetical protein
MHRHAGRDQFLTLAVLHDLGGVAGDGLSGVCGNDRSAVGIGSVQQNLNAGRTPPFDIARESRQHPDDAIHTSPIHRILHLCVGGRRGGNDESAGTQKLRKQLAAVGTVIFVHPGDAGAIYIEIGGVSKDQQLHQRRKQQQAPHPRVSKYLAEFLADDGTDTLSHTFLMRSFASACARPRMKLPPHRRSTAANRTIAAAVPNPSGRFPW